MYGDKTNQIVDVLRSMRIEAGEEADWLTTTDLTASLGLRLKTVCRAIAAQRSYRKPNVESNYAACTYRPNIGVKNVSGDCGFEKDPVAD